MIGPVMPSKKLLMLTTIHIRILLITIKELYSFNYTLSITSTQRLLHNCKWLTWLLEINAFMLYRLSNKRSDTKDGRMFLKYIVCSWSTIDLLSWPLKYSVSYDFQISSEGNFYTAKWLYDIMTFYFILSRTNNYFDITSTSLALMHVFSQFSLFHGAK